MATENGRVSSGDDLSGATVTAEPQMDSGWDVGTVQLAQATVAAVGEPIQLPQGRTVVVVPVTPGQTITLPTDDPEGLPARIGPEGNLAIVVDGRTIIFQGYVAANEQAPVRFQTEDGDPIDVADLVAATDPNIDIPTAGGPPSGDQGDTTSSGIFTPFVPGPGPGPLQAVGILGATGLGYKLIDDNRVDLYLEDNNDIEEEEGPPEEVSTFAVVNPEGPAFLKEDVETPVALTATPGPGDTVTQIVLDNIPAGWTVNQAGISLSSGTIGNITLAGGTLTIDITGAAPDTAITAIVPVTAAEDTDVDGAALVVRATAVEGADTAAGQSNFDAPVDAVLDQFLDVSQSGAPVIVENEGLQNVGLNLITVIVGAAGNPFPNSGAGGADTDGSELLPTTAQISLPQTVIDLVLGAGAPAGATLLETAPQSGTWTLSAANPADLQSALGFVQAVIPGGFVGTINGTVTVTTTEANTPAGTAPASGAEPDTGDNSVTDTTPFSIVVEGEVPVGPSAEDATALVDEDGLPIIGNNNSQPGDDAADTPPDVTAGETTWRAALPVSWNGLTGTISLAAGDWSALRSADGDALVAVGNGTGLLQAYDSSDAPGGIPNPGATPVFEISIVDAAAGTYEVRLLQPLQHPDSNGNPADDGTDDGTGSFEDNLSVPVSVTYTNGNGSVTRALDIEIDDDAPVANPLSEVATDARTRDTNLLLILDSSGSMVEDSGLTNLSKLELAVAAIKELVDLYDSRGNVVIQIVTFGTGAATQPAGVWLTVDQARAFLDSVATGGQTNYDAALTEAIAAFGQAGKIAGAQNVAYFLSDNNPNRPIGDVGIDATEEATWTDFLKANDITAYALGVGTAGIDPAQLHPVAYNGELEIDTKGEVVKDLNLLSSTLAATVEASVSGNLLTDSGSKAGADGGRVGQISFGGTTFIFDGTTITRTGPALPFTQGAGVLTFTATGFEFLIDMNSGSYSYTVLDNASLPQNNSISYLLIDGDGDAAGNVLQVQITDADNAPIVRDDLVIASATGGAGTSIFIPDYALLWNDTDDEGQPLAFGSVSGVTGLTSAVHGVSGVTVIDNDFAGGSFDYTASANGKSDSGEVTVNRGQSGDNPVDGNGLDNIIIDRNSGSTLNGFEDHDVLIGNGGADKLNGGAGRDLLVGGTGADTLNLSADADDHDTVLITSVLDGNDTVNQFGDGVANGGAASQDFINLDLLFDSIGVATGDRAGRVQISDGGANALVTVDLTGNGFGAGDIVITLTGIASPANLTAGNAATDDIQLGTA